MKTKTIVIVCKTPITEVINYYSRNFRRYKIIVVCPQKIPKRIDLNNEIEVINDNQFLDKRFLDNYNILRKNWIYQQLLKYEIVLKLPYESITIVDGDSILNEKLLDVKKIFYTRKKVDKNYLLYINNLFPNFNIVDKNFITNQMTFSKKTLVDMLDKISKVCWKKELIRNLSIDKQLSEYELFAQYRINNENDFQLNEIKVFRRFDLIYSNSIADAIKKYSLISYENHHNTSLSKIIFANFLYLLNRNYG